MSYPQFGYPYSSAPQVSPCFYLFSVNCMFFFILLRLIILSIWAWSFYAFWPRIREAVTALSRIGKVLGFSQLYVFLAIERKKDKKKEIRNQRDPRAPVHWFLKDNSRSVMSTICLCAAHTCQLVRHTLCVLCHNPAAALVLALSHTKSFGY